MSASTQTGTTQQPPTNGNGHAKAPRKARGPNKQKAPAKAAAPLQAGQQPAIIAGAASNVAARRIGPAIPTTITGPISIAWLREREQYLETEVRVATGRLTEIRSMIASFGPRKEASTATPRKAKAKRSKRRSTTMK